MPRKYRKQVFCNCGKGRAFIVTERKGAVAEWIKELEIEGWRFLNASAPGGKAIRCHICGPTQEYRDGIRVSPSA